MVLNVPCWFDAAFMFKYSVREQTSVFKLGETVSE